MQKQQITVAPLRFVHYLRLLNEKSEGETDSKGQRTRIDIKIAAAKLLEKHGFDDFSLADVAKLAQVSRPAVYQYYANKQSLVLELLADFQLFMSQTLSQPKSAQVADHEPRSLEAINLAYVHFFAANARVIVSIQQIRRSLSGAAKLQFELNEFWAQKIANRLLAAQDSKQASVQETALLQAYALEHMVDGLLTDIYVRKNPRLKHFVEQPDLVAKVLTGMWLQITKRVDAPT